MAEKKLNKWLDKYNTEGSIIQDNNGQWAHPGEVTKINSNKITMEGVLKPVIGISDTGDMKFMEPNKKYTFKGNSVTEYPKAQYGYSKNISSAEGLFNNILERNLPVNQNTDYNIKRALELGYTADETGHWPSIDEETGEWLKSANHPTRGMEMMEYELNPELHSKYSLIKNDKGNLQYVERENFEEGGKFSKAQKGKKIKIKKEGFENVKDVILSNRNLDKSVNLNLKERNIVEKDKQLLNKKQLINFTDNNLNNNWLDKYK